MTTNKQQYCTLTQKFKAGNGTYITHPGMLAYFTQAIHWGLHRMIQGLLGTQFCKTSISYWVLGHNTF